MSVKFTHLILASLMLSASACQAGEAVEPAKISKSDYVKTSKPGAAIRFTHDYNGSAKAGEVREVKINISDKYDSGTLRIDIIPNDNLSLGDSAGSYRFDMSGSDAHELTIAVKALSEGSHTLNFNTTAQYGDQQVARGNNAITFNTGVVVQKSAVSNFETLKKTQATPGIIVMDAQEVISVDVPTSREQK